MLVMKSHNKQVKYRVEKNPMLWSMKMQKLWSRANPFWLLLRKEPSSKDNKSKDKWRKGPKK